MQGLFLPAARLLNSTLSRCSGLPFDQKIVEFRALLQFLPQPDGLRPSPRPRRPRLRVAVLRRYFAAHPGIAATTASRATLAAKSQKLMLQVFRPSAENTINILAQLEQSVDRHRRQIRTFSHMSLQYQYCMFRTPSSERQ
jgi:hypothetical protein